MPEVLRLAANGEVDAFPITGIYSTAGELDHAFEWFDKALADPMLTARYIGELSLHAGDRVALTPEPARIHRFDESGNAIRG